MERLQKNAIITDLSRKIVLLMGPRQCGKTTLAKQLTKTFDYFNYDLAEDRQALQQKIWQRNTELVIFDELHKMKNWKRWLKGVYDTESIPPAIIVTGSAKLNAYRKVGDSLAGRYFLYHLHPLDVKEACQFWKDNRTEAFDRIMQLSGFPEPFLDGNKTYYNRWRKTHLDIILRQDLVDAHTTQNIKAIETLVTLLKQRVGSTVSYANLARALETDIHTIKRWLEWLENLYVIFKVTPYHHNIERSLLKEPKYYFYDTAQVQGTDGDKLENLIACALLKELHWIEDTAGLDVSLHFLRTKDGKELDFAVSIDKKITHIIEAKWGDQAMEPNFNHFIRYFPDAEKLQLVKELKRASSHPNGVQICAAVDWLAEIDLLRDSSSTPT